MSFSEKQAAESAASAKVQVRTAARLPADFCRLIKDAEAVLKFCGGDEAAENLRKAADRISACAFKAAVVGEFKRGKSSFINSFMERELVPVDVLPATALVTNIRSAAQEGLYVLDAKGRVKEKRPVKMESWRGLTVKPDASQELEGSVRLDVCSDILSGLGLELIDTPGAGDLDPSRESSIDRALLGGDGAIIAVSAKSAMSLSEKTFVSEQLLSRHTPYLMLIVTYLDTVNEAERAEILEYISDKLAAWQRELKTEKEIPIFIPADIKIPGDKWNKYIGLDKIRERLRLWAGDANRIELMQEYLAALACAYLNTELEIKRRIKEERDCADAEKREKMRREKLLQLDRESLRLRDLELEWERRIEGCQAAARALIERHAEEAVSELEYSASLRAGDLKRWYGLDRPHLLKKLNAVLVGRLNGLLTNRLRGDAAWFSNSISGKASAPAELQLPEDIFDAAVSSSAEELIENGDTGKTRKLAQLGIGAATLGGLALASVFNLALAPITITIGVGTAGKLLADKLLSKKSEELLEALKRQLRLETPELFNKAGEDVAEMIEASYASVFSEVKDKAERRLAALRSSVNDTAASQSSQKGGLEKAIARLEAALDSLSVYLRDEK